MKKIDQPLNQRRTFLKQIATGAAVLSTGVLAMPLQSLASRWFRSGCFLMQMTGLRK